MPFRRASNAGCNSHEASWDVVGIVGLSPKCAKMPDCSFGKGVRHQQMLDQYLQEQPGCGKSPCFWHVEKNM